jgi:hypothetical protein
VVNSFKSVVWLHSNDKAMFLPFPKKGECQIVTQNHTMSRSIQLDRQRFVETVHIWFITWIRDNDPSAGSPTETLLRLLLPLNDQV